MDGFLTHYRVNILRFHNGSSGRPNGGETPDPLGTDGDGDGDDNSDNKYRSNVVSCSYRFR